jgi:NADH-quinone oxidoreductase subunit L
MPYLWAIPLLPGIGAALNGLVGIRLFSRRASGMVACVAMAGSLALSLLAFAQLVALPPDARIVDVVVADWIPAIAAVGRDGSAARLSVPWAFRLDPLAAMMLLVVTGIGTLIHVYATAYMHDEPRPGVARFFAYLNLFCFFMLLLVLGSNFLVMFVGWEGVGLCSYLLIGYWFERTRAADAGRKAFLTNRVGDWGFLLGILLVFWTFGTLDFRAVAAAVGSMPVEAGHFGLLSTIALLLFVGATGKSAQIPLYVWLPDAMEGPTPVSALIHAATMVTAGVYMLGRNAALFAHAPIVLQIVAVVGVSTAFLAATIALVQTDIKRVLAYSTVSQLGYMFTAVGVGAFAAGAFHLMTHAFFKALLFLGSGSVIHAMEGEQDMRRMGGLRGHLPVTFATMMVGALAIAGVPPLSGFFSKDEILFRAFTVNRAVWLVALATALLTAFYMSRLVALTFLGAYRGPSPAQQAHSDSGAARAWHGPHESPRAMTVPLMALAAGAALAGFVGVPAALGGGNPIEQFLAPSFGLEHAESAVHVSHAVELLLMGVSVAGAALGIGLAWRLYVVQPGAADRLAMRFAAAHRVLSGKYFVDEFYGATIVRAVFASARALWAVDRRIVDGVVNGSSWLTLFGSWISGRTDRTVVDGLVNGVGRRLEAASFLLRRLQTGLVQSYAMLMLVGVFVFVSLYLFVR